MNLSRIMIASLNLVLAVNSFAGGFSTWEQTTPGNNTILIIYKNGILRKIILLVNI